MAIITLDEIKDHARKDILIAWAYRRMRETEAITCADGKVRYPSGVCEFMAAAEALVPDVETLAEAAHFHPDVAISK